MEGLSSLVLGLGLFFLGMQLVGENLRRLSGRSFRNVMHRVAARPFIAALAGLGFGALMQSATAVTFILASMQKSGLITAHGAAPVILWCNVGLTALVFLATLDIHPLVAYFTGAAGILSALIRQSIWRTVAGGLLGSGLILFGLQAMSEGAEPLKSEAWFQAFMAGAVSSAGIAFGVGILSAAILQSNTGAAMLIITLAAAGEFNLHQAALLIYGSNLGAIGLRVFLSLNLDSASKRLVRFEDIFCLWTSVVMIALTLGESAGLPGPLALASFLAPESLQFQIAILFLLSNLIPATLFSPFIKRVIDLLKKWIPESDSEVFSKPRFLSNTSAGDPGTAADLALQESARLLGSLKLTPTTPHRDTDGESSPPREFTDLSVAIERFLNRVSTTNRLDHTDAHSIHLIRSELGVIRYLEDAVRDFNEQLLSIHQPMAKDSPVHPMIDSLSKLLTLATECATHPALENVSIFRDATRKNHPDVKQAKETTLSHINHIDQSTSTTISTLRDAYDLAVWMLHRLAKIQERYITEL